MALARRLMDLEKRLSPPPPRECRVCGRPLSPGPPDPASVTVSWHAPGEDPPAPCPACGRTGVVWIEFDRAG